MGRYARPRAGARRVAPAPRERALQDRLIEAARLSGWYATTHAGERIELVYHVFDSRRSAPGFPDLIMVRDGVLLALECKRSLAEVRAMAKSPRGRAQLAWIEAMNLVPGVRAAVICPDNETLALSWITARAPRHQPAPAEAS